MAEESVFDFRQDKIFFSFHIVHTGSGVHTAFYSAGTMGYFPGDKAAEASS
jgi:hypothetical protein